VLLGAALPAVLIADQTRSSLARTQVCNLGFLLLVLGASKLLFGSPSFDRCRTALVHFALAFNILVGLAEGDWSTYKDSAQSSCTLGLGGLLVVSQILFASNYGVAVAETEQRGVEVRSNLSLLWITAYSFWLVLSYATFHPEQAGYFIWISLLVPYATAILYHTDWLETHVVARLFAVVVHAGLPSTPALQHLPLAEDSANWFQREELRWTVVGLGLFCALVMLVDVWVAQCQGESGRLLYLGGTMCPYPIDDSRGTTKLYDDMDSDDEQSSLMPRTMA